MNRLFTILLLFISIIGAGAQPQTPDTKMHRSQATTRGTGGWYLAKSTEGHFTVQLPVPFNDYTITTDDANVGVMKTYCIGGKNKAGLKFSATETPITAKMNRPDVEALLKNFNDGNNAIAQIDRATFFGNDAISFKIKAAASNGYIKYVITSKSLITMILEYPAAQEGAAAGVVKRFFESLKL